VGEWVEILRVAGPWGGPVVAFVVAYARGYIATGRELKQLETANAELRGEVKYWRDLAWSFSRIAEQTAGALPPKDAK
jgi:hypothetical protein